MWKREKDDICVNAFLRNFQLAKEVGKDSQLYILSLDMTRKVSVPNIDELLFGLISFARLSCMYNDLCYLEGCFDLAISGRPVIVNKLKAKYDKKPFAVEETEISGIEFVPDEEMRNCTNVTMKFSPIKSE